MKALLSLEYRARFPRSDSPFLSQSVIGYFEAEISIPALPSVGHVISLPVICDISETYQSPDDCKVTLVAFDLKNGTCVPHIYCERELNGEECFEAGNKVYSKQYQDAISSALKDLDEDIAPRLKRQGFKKVYTAV